jgi:hypothetical protein
VNRTKYYNFYRYAFRLAESIYLNGVTPPMSRYVIDHRGEAERSDRRPTFAEGNVREESRPDDGIVRGAQKVAIGAWKRQNRVAGFLSNGSLRPNQFGLHVEAFRCPKEFHFHSL